MGKALDTIKKLQVVEFNWKHNDKPDIGLIAESVERVIPEAVLYDENKVLGLKPLTLIAVLVKAVQELEEK